jgi:hypothetical protein
MLRSASKTGSAHGSGEASRRIVARRCGRAGQAPPLQRKRSRRPMKCFARVVVVDRGGAKDYVYGSRPEVRLCFSVSCEP